MNDPENGDMLISGMQRKLWALTYDCLHKFGCPVMFDLVKWDVSKGREQVIMFFVPRQHLRLQEVKEYIFDELADHNMPTSNVGDTKIPASSVHVLEFSGIDFYHTAAEIGVMIESLKSDFINRLQPH